MVTMDERKYLVLRLMWKEAWFLEQIISQEQLISQEDLQEIMWIAARRFSINRGVLVSKGREKRLC